MKILFCITSLALGGAEKVVCELADRLVSEGHLVKIAFLTGEIIVRPSSSSIEIINLRLKKKHNFLRSFFLMRELLINFEPDIVHSHMFHANIFCRFIALFSSPHRLICTAHSNNEGGWLRMFLYRITDSIPFVSTNVSAEAVREFIRLRATNSFRMIPVYNGINLDRFHFRLKERDIIRANMKAGPDLPIFLAVGRLQPAKDYPNLLKAFKDVLITIPNALLWIIGSGSSLGELETMAIKLGISPNVSFLGSKEDIENWMSASDVFVLSSAWEGFGLVVAEAMACERIVVATDSGGVAEVVGDCGYIVEKCSSKMLSKAMINAFDKNNRKNLDLGCYARRRIYEKFDGSEILKQWVNIYSLPKLQKKYLLNMESKDHKS